MKNNKRRRSRFVGHYLHLFGYMAIVSVVVGLLFLFIQKKYCPSNDRYVLSTISQSLAALSALILAFTLIVLEMGHRHKGLIDEFIRIWPNWIYPIANTIGIIGPLILLKRGIFDIWTYIAICYATFCISMIFPYFMRVKLFIKYNIGIRHNAEQAKTAISEPDTYEYEMILKSIYGLSQESTDFGNPGVINVAFREIYELLIYKYKKIRNHGQLEQTIAYLVDIIKDAGKQKVIKDISKEIFTFLHYIIQQVHLKNKRIYRNLISVLLKICNETLHWWKPVEEKVKKNMYSSVLLIIAKGKWRKTECDELKKQLKVNITDETNRATFLQCCDPNVFENVYSVKLENAEKSIMLALQKFL